MTPYNVNTHDYLASDEFNSIKQFISSVRDIRSNALQQRYPEYRIRPRYNKNQDISYSFLTHNLPFYDIPCEVLLHKDTEGYIELNEWHYQLNCYMKNMFHRRWWSEHDRFLNFVYTNWKEQQSSGEFDKFEQTARTAFATHSSLLDYHREFVYNPDIVMITLDDVRKLFASLVDVGLLLSQTVDLYQVYSGVEFDDADTNIKHRVNSGIMTEMDILHLKSKFKVSVLPKLQQLNCKYTFVPSPYVDEFEGIWLLHKLNGHVWFLPQFLIFYSSK